MCDRNSDVIGVDGVRQLRHTDAALLQASVARQNALRQTDLVPSESSCLFSHIKHVFIGAYSDRQIGGPSDIVNGEFVFW